MRVTLLVKVFFILFHFSLLAGLKYSNQRICVCVFFEHIYRLGESFEINTFVHKRTIKLFALFNWFGHVPQFGTKKNWQKMQNTMQNMYMVSPALYNLPLRPYKSNTETVNKGYRRITKHLISEIKRHFSYWKDHQYKRDTDLVTKYKNL